MSESRWNHLRERAPSANLPPPPPSPSLNGEVAGPPELEVDLAPFLPPLTPWLEAEPAPEPAPEASAAALPEDHDEVEVVIPAGLRKPMPWLAALASARLPYRLERGAGGWKLRVPASWAARARRELEAYQRLNYQFPPPQPDEQAWRPARAADPGVSFWLAVALVLFYVQTGPFADAGAVVHRGAADAVAIRAGEWWRGVTALTLHADLIHVGANAVCLAVFGRWLCQSVGLGLGWAAIVLAGAFGNLAAVGLSQPPDGHSAVGASTATFGALGVLVMFACRRRFSGWRELRSVWSRSWGPLLAGVSLLAFLGTGPGTDLLGHFYGFVCGLLLGVLLLPALDRPLPGWSQVLIGILTAGTVAACWWLVVQAQG
ncbi:MAG: rhomboid family intramembrane serine protease [bacterium]